MNKKVLTGGAAVALAGAGIYKVISSPTRSSPTNFSDVTKQMAPGFF